MSTVNRRMSLRSSYLDRLKQKLKLLLDATTDLPSTKTRASGKRGVIFRNTIPGQTLTNTRKTLSLNEALKEEEQVRKSIIRQVANLYRTIENYEASLRQNGSSNKSESYYIENFNNNVMGKLTRAEKRRIANQTRKSSSSTA